MSAKDPIVVTGLGVISPIGLTVPIFFDNLIAGKSGISRVDRFNPEPFKCQIAGQVRDFDPKSYYLKKKKIKQNDLSTHFAV
jgi:3-oxoacyl-[acyl-carrier-protein] synthase II